MVGAKVRIGRVVIMRGLMFFGAVVGLVLAPSAAMADWSDNFDSYAPGSINGQGGWHGWGADPSVAGRVVTDMSLSAPQSQKIGGGTGTDSVHEYSGYTSGHWTYTARQFIPETFTGTAPSYFIMVRQYTDPSGPYAWSVQMGFNPTTGQVDADVGGVQQHMPFIKGQWIPIRVEIYLDDDWAKLFYNNVLIDDPALPDKPLLGGGYQWSKGVFGSDTDGILNIAAVDLFDGYTTAGTPGSSAVYYDNMSLTPEPASLVLLGLGLLLVNRRR
jgi:hypothetical protein